MKHVLAQAALAAVLAWPAAPQQTLPAAASILDKYVDATGGKAAYEKLRTEVSTSNLTFAATGLSGTITIYRAAPNKSYMAMEIPGAGKIEEGTDGEIAWSNSAIQGPRVKDGDEKNLAFLMAAFASEVRWRDFYKSAETVGAEDVNGKSCYRVEMLSNDGLKQTRWYEKETSLLAKVAMTVKSAMGEVPTETVMGDYRADGGILRPHKSTTKVMGQEIVTVVESVKPNVEIEPSRFAPPEEVKALLKKGK